MGWTNNAAKALFEEFEHDYQEHIDKEPGIEKFIARVPEIAVRLATIRAAGRQIGHNEHSTVNLADMEWGAALAHNAANRMVTEATIDMVDDCQSHGKKVNKVLEFFPETRTTQRSPRETGGREVRRTELMRKVSKSMNKRDLDGIVDQLEEAGIIAVKKVIPPPGGKPTIFYWMV